MHRFAQWVYGCASLLRRSVATAVSLELVNVSAVVLLWTVLLGALLYSGVVAIRGHTRDIARAQARAFFQQILDSRTWVAERGGVYVPLNEKTPVNAYLDPSDRVVTTTDGKVLTKVNPAYMTRQIGEAARRSEEPTST